MEKKFIDNISKMHPNIKFTPDVYVKPTDSHQYLLSFSWHPFYCKKGMPYSQTLRVNRTCANNEFFDKRCNYLEKYPLEWGYSEKMVHKEILRARAIHRDGLLEKINNQEKQNKITFSITYHPVFRDVRNILKELHLILGSDDGNKKVFPDVPMIGFKKKKKKNK